MGCFVDLFRKFGIQLDVKPYCLDRGHGVWYQQKRAECGSRKSGWRFVPWPRFLGSPGNPQNSNDSLGNEDSSLTGAVGTQVEI
jgi:hypothetical protein